ncbi:MAG: MotA/TolQ/ExbB proton channel family protein [Candidatus Muiribacteriota bacterium]
MFPIAFMWLVVLFLIIKFFLNYFSDKRNIEKLKKHNSLIIYIGSFAFLFGVLGQMLGLYGALDAIEAAGDISPYLIAGGLKVSMLTVMYGFSLMLISSIFWFIFRNLISKNISK